MSFQVILEQLTAGFGKTLIIFFLTLILSMPLGLIVCLGRMSKWSPFGFLSKKGVDPTGITKVLIGFRPIQLIFKLYISVLRGTPLMLQLLAVCYGPYYLFGAKLAAGWTFTAVILGFMINYSAYFAEIYRGGIESMPVGQYEAAEVLGYTKFQTFMKIILPQVIKRILPSVTNEIITLVKDTSLAFVLAYAEMFTIAKQIAAAKTTFMPLFVAGIFYFIFNAVVAYTMEFCEKKLSYYR